MVSYGEEQLTGKLPQINGAYDDPKYGTCTKVIRNKTYNNVSPIKLNKHGIEHQQVDSALSFVKLAFLLQLILMWYCFHYRLIGTRWCVLSCCFLVDPSGVICRRQKRLRMGDYQLIPHLHVSTV